MWASLALLVLCNFAMTWDCTLFEETRLLGLTVLCSTALW